MISQVKNVDEFIESLPSDRKDAVRNLRNTIKKHLPKGYQETMGNNMINYSVPHSKYPGGYHCDPKQPLPFLSIASQKNFIALYHMGLYAMPDLLKWFNLEYPKHCQTKLDMGKSCVRFKKPEQIPYELIGELAGKVDPDTCISVYEQNLRR